MLRSNAPPAIISLTVSGFKSIVEEQTLEIRPLTLLAGRNGSGKSSMMQPLLLLKQTLEAPFDPGPLQLDGPNVGFTSSRQFRPAGSPPGQAVPFMIWLGLSDDTGFVATFQSQESQPITLASNVVTGFKRPILIERRISVDDLISLAPSDFVAGRLQQIKDRYGNTCLKVARDRFHLTMSKGCHPDLWPLFGNLSMFQYKVDRAIRGLVHLPARRDDTERTYSVSPVGPVYPGTFGRHVASLIAQWGSESPDRVRQVSDDLKSLGLTWKIEAIRINETQVELRVGRLPSPERGEDGDLVDIADAGCGVWQALPVVVALRAASPGQLVSIERPEIQLHPRAQVAMARLLVDAAKRGVRVVSETHSSLILLAVRTLVAEGVIEPGLVGLNWFLRDEKDGITRIKTAELDEVGRFGEWPEDFDEVALEAENRYLSAAETRLAKG
jgi:hypothetical protein